MDIKRISVIGLGKLGTPLLAALASKGYHVIGVDVDPAKVEAINAGQSPVDEPGVQELLSAYDGFYRAASDTKSAVGHTDATFVIVPTPSKPNGTFSVDLVLGACRQIGEALKVKRRYHLVVITSTVMPGDTATEIIPELERASGKRAGVDFDVCYSPEFIALGDVLRGLMQPDMVLVGSRTSRGAAALAEIATRLTGGAKIASMSLESAELCKLSINTFITMKIAFANTLAQVCHNLPHADVDDVTHAMKLDRRISPHAFGAGAPFGGPCFPRDGIAFARMAAQRGANTELADAVTGANLEMLTWIYTMTHTYAHPGDTIAVLGMAYKPGTNVTEESAGVEIARRLENFKSYDGTSMFNVVTYDPLAECDANSAQAAVDAADVVLVMLPLDEFRLLKFRPAQTVIDVWRLYDHKIPGVNHIRLGMSSRTWWREFAPNAQEVPA